MLEQDNRISRLEKAVSSLKNENDALKLMVDDLEGRSRRNNIKIFGIPEQEEGNKSTEFIEALVPQLLGKENFQTPVIIDQAHRTLRPPPPDGAKPRAFIAGYISIGKGSSSYASGEHNWITRATRCSFSRITPQKRCSNDENSTKSWARCVSSKLSAAFSSQRDFGSSTRDNSGFSPHRVRQ